MNKKIIVLVLLCLSLLLFLLTLLLKTSILSILIIAVISFLLCSAAIIISCMHLNKNEPTKYLKLQSLVVKKKAMLSVLICLYIILNIGYIGLVSYALIYDINHKVELTLSNYSYQLYETAGSNSIENVEIPKEKEEEEVFEQTFNVSDYGGTTLSCGEDIPTGTYTISGSNQDGNTMLFSIFRSGEGIAQGDYLDMHDPFSCYTGREIMAYNDTGSFTVHSFHKIDVRENWQDVDMYRNYTIDEYTGETATEECYYVLDEKNIPIDCQEMYDMEINPDGDYDSYDIESKLGDETYSETYNFITIKYPDKEVAYTSTACGNKNDFDMSLYTLEDVLLCYNEDESLFDLMEYTETGTVSTFETYDTNIETGKLNYK